MSVNALYVYLKMPSYCIEFGLLKTNQANFVGSLDNSWATFAPSMDFMYKLSPSQPVLYSHCEMQPDVNYGKMSNNFRSQYGITVRVH